MERFVVGTSTASDLIIAGWQHPVRLEGEPATIGDPGGRCLSAHFDLGKIWGSVENLFRGATTDTKKVVFGLSRRGISQWSPYVQYSTYIHTLK